MGFLKHAPIVFVVGNEYEIVVVSKENGLCWLEIGGEKYYEENSGVLHTEQNRVKIRVPQMALDKAETYTIVYRRSIDRKAYFSQLGEEERYTYAFRPLKKSEDICVYHLADIHYEFKLAKKCAAFFGEKLDLLIVNGDTAEVETEKNYLDVYNFLGEMLEGKLPVLFLRGNHDTRGRSAERFEEFFPCQNKKFYYTFEVGALRGIVFDCGEDKLDGGDEYGGVNIFERYRKEETQFLQELSKEKTLLPPFAVGHICPAHTTRNKGDVFDIERETYMQWNEEFERLGISFMLCGHMHKAYILNGDAEENTLPHGYPVIIGSACYLDELWGTALVIGKESMKIYFTDSNQAIREEYSLDYNEKYIKRVNSEK